MGDEVMITGGNGSSRYGASEPVIVQDGPSLIGQFLEATGKEFELDETGPELEAGA